MGPLRRSQGGHAGGIAKSYRGTEFETFSMGAVTHGGGPCRGLAFANQVVSSLQGSIVQDVSNKAALAGLLHV